MPRNGVSDWLRRPWGCCRKCEERLTGGDGDAEWKEAELPKEPGMFTGAELCNKLPPAGGERPVSGEARGPRQAGPGSSHHPGQWTPTPRPPQPRTHGDAAWVGCGAAIESLLQRGHPELGEVQVIQSGLWEQSERGLSLQPPGRAPQLQASPLEPTCPSPPPLLPPPHLHAQSHWTVLSRASARGWAAPVTRAPTLSA